MKNWSKFTGLLGTRLGVSDTSDRHGNASYRRRRSSPIRRRRPRAKARAGNDRGRAEKPDHQKQGREMRRRQSSFPSDELVDDPAFADALLGPGASQASSSGNQTLEMLRQRHHAIVPTGHQLA